MILSPIIQTIASALILGLLCASSFAEGGKEEMHLMTYRVPRDTFFLPDSVKEPQPITGVSLLRGEWPAATYDVHEFLKASVGLTFPPGAEAIFVNKSSFLLLRNTSANLELADIVFGAENYPPNTVRLEVEVVSFNLPGDLLNKPPQTLAELRKAAAGSWREIASQKFMIRGGSRTKNAGTDKDQARFQAEVEAVLGPNAEVIGVTGSFEYENPSNHPSLKLDFQGETVLWSGVPQILMLSQTSEGGPAYALVLRATAIEPTGGPNPPVKESPPTSAPSPPPR